MERQKQIPEEWHYETAVRLSRLAIAMTQAFTTGHEAVQTEEYEQLREAYLQLEADKKEHDRFDPPEYKSHFQLG